MLNSRLSQLLAEGHARNVSLLPGDGPLSEHPTNAVSAGVLVAITDRPDPGVILTQRPDHMRKHPGQVAFPGGRMDESDADVIAAAIREAHEEIALDPNMVDIIGTTDPYLTITGFRVTPVIAVIPPDLPLHPNEGEVAAIFETPLSFLLDPANHLTNSYDWQGGKRTYHEMFWNDRRIWGATAAMIVNLSQRLAWT